MLYYYYACGFVLSKYQLQSRCAGLLAVCVAVADTPGRSTPRAKRPGRELVPRELTPAQQQDQSSTWRRRATAAATRFEIFWCFIIVIFMDRLLNIMEGEY